MKNKKIMLVFIAMIIFVMAIMPIVKASDNNPFNIKKGKMNVPKKAPTK